MYPDDGTHVDDTVMIRMVEVGCGMHRAMRRGHVSGMSGTGVAVVTVRWIVSTVTGNNMVAAATVAACTIATIPTAAIAVAATVSVNTVVAAAMTGTVVEVAPRIVVGFTVHIAVTASGRRGTDRPSDSRMTAVDIAGIVTAGTIALDSSGIMT